MTRARLLAAAAALLAALLLARLAFAPEPPPAQLALPALDAPPPSPWSPPPPSSAPPSSAPPSPVPFSPVPSSPGSSPVLPPPSGSPRPSTPPSRPARLAAPPTLPELREALAVLDALRAEAFADPATADPDAWATRSCACHAADARTLRALARDGLALRPPAVTIDALVLAAPPTPARADLLLTDRLSAYTAVDAAGAVVRRWPATPPRRWRVTLVRAGERWLLGAVARAP